jgi:uncharacterized protein (TIGR02996 family)
LDEGTMNATSDAAEREYMGRILAAPSDDEPRLAYAAWLRRRGDPRGDFIHAQCVLQGPEDGEDPDELRRLHALLSGLLKAHELAWTAELREIVGAADKSNYYPATFNRGFVDSLIVPADVFAAAADRIFAAAPLLRRVNISAPLQGRLDERLGQALGARPELAAVAAVRLFCLGLADDAFVAFVRSPHLGGLHELDLGANALGPRSVAALLAAPFAANLASLDLWRNRVGDEGAELIAASASPSVRRIQLGESGIGARGGVALARSRRLGAVEVLELQHNPLGDEAACALVGSGSLAALRSLNIYEVGLGVEGAGRLCELPGLGRIEQLSIGGNRIGDRGLRALAGSPHTGALVGLDLEGSEIGDEGVAALAEARALERLRELGLRYNRITEVGARALAMSSRLPGLIDLDLAYNDIHGEYTLLERRFGGANLVGQGMRDELR